MDQEQHILYEKGLQKALYLLGDMPRTERQLRQKLEQSRAGYPPAVVDAIIEEMKGYGYIDDAEYTRNYFRSRGGSRSLRAMTFELQQKGVSREVISLVQEEEDWGAGEAAAIERLAEKRKIDPRTASMEEMQRLYRYLAGKGFSFDTIRRTVEQMR